MVYNTYLVPGYYALFRINDITDPCIYMYASYAPQAPSMGKKNPIRRVNRPINRKKNGSYEYYYSLEKNRRWNPLPLHKKATRESSGLEVR